MNIANIVTYWRDSLADAELNTIEPGQKTAFSVPWHTLAMGRLDKPTVAKVFIAAGEEEAVRNIGNKGQSQEAPVFAPVTVIANMARPMERSRSRVGRRKTFYPLFIPAELDSMGRLHPMTESGPALPWLPRNLLEPTSSDLVLGDVQSLERFYADRPLDVGDAEPEEQWRVVWEYARELLRTVAGKQWRNTLLEAGYRVVDRGFVIPGDQMAGMAQNIMNVYDRLLSRKDWPPLLQNYVSSSPPAPKEPSTAPDWRNSALMHLGSFQTRFPLSPSQREALYNFLPLSQSSVLAVSGPPGTGKTTLLHSVIASLWVKAALERKSPPVVVVSSTNNQAVTNVVDSLQSLREVERWLDVPGFGLYLVNSKKKQRDARDRNIPTANRYGDGFPDNIENGTFISRETQKFLEKCSDHFGLEFSTVSHAVSALHTALSKTATLMREGIEIAYDLKEYRRQLRKLEQREGNLEAHRKRLEEETDRQEKRMSELEDISRGWRRQLKEKTGCFGWGSVIPLVRKFRLKRNRLFVEQHLPNVKVAYTTEAINHYLEGQLHNQRRLLKQCQQRRNVVQELFLQCERTEELWHKWRATAGGGSLEIDCLFNRENDSGGIEERCLLNWLDTHLRYDLFVHATHYWEGRWLQEVERIEAAVPGFKESQSQEVQEQKWRRYAMLTPCFVTTMHSGPGFFDYYDGQSQPLLDFIDLLIVDEAGQVTPEVGGAMFALARQALVVGDVKQIEPVWNALEAVDRGNLRRRSLARTPEEFRELTAQGVTASSGSVMRMAQSVSPYQIPACDGVVYERGMFLAEHRRSVPQIISYCNKLAYSGRLRMKRKPLSDYAWPHMGYVHVKGRSERTRGSRKNEREALAVVGWIVENREALKRHYAAEISDIVGIVTPFAAQKVAIKAALVTHDIEIGKVGTVHALQGGERPVILFSSVYDSGDTGRYFFDRGPNMLNVAVSRARDSFIVFGDMDIMDPAKRTPSGLLAQHLFESAENEIVDLALPGRINSSGQNETVHPMRTLRRHVAALSRAFKRAKRRLVIVSPYLRWRAVRADAIPQQVAAAVKRGVDVTVYVDDGFNANLEMPSAAKAAKALRQSGATITVCHNIHSKIVCIDEEIFIEGSFNWLSAERDLEEYRRYETSTIYMGPSAPQFIEQVLHDLDERAVTRTI